MRLRLAKLLATVALLAACGPGLYSREWFDTEADAQATLARRASFDLQCEAEQLRFTPLGAHDYPYKTVGVQGCSRSATYVMKWGEWLMNDASTVESGPSPTTREEGVPGAARPNE